MAKKSCFLPALSEYFSEYLPKIKGLSENTIRSYKHAFRLLLEYIHAGHGLLPEKIEFRHLEKGVAGVALYGQELLRKNEKQPAFRTRYVCPLRAPQKF